MQIHTRGQENYKITEKKLVNQINMWERLLIYVGVYMEEWSTKRLNERQEIQETSFAANNRNLLLISD